MANLVFYIGSSIPETAVFPCYQLIPAIWDDFGLKTSFHLYRVESEETRQKIGLTKIAVRGQIRGKTPMPGDHFPYLDNSYFSLGQSTLFFERLTSVGADEKRRVLNALRDVTRFTTNQRGAIETELAFMHSLVRTLGSSSLAKLNGKMNSVAVSFGCKIHGSKRPTTCNFNFEFDKHFPGNINVLIGKNGVGKTQFLAKFVANLVGVDDTEPPAVIGRTSISKVIVVSYSIFDRFFLPGEIRVPGSKSRTEYVSKNLMYVYIGLRERTENDNTYVPGPITFAKRFSSSIKKLVDNERFDSWRSIVKPILQEAEFGEDEDLEAKSARIKFRRLGAGHKATLSFLTNLYVELEEGSLVVIDEPENHLHPTLLSATMHVLRSMLIEHKSMAVVSTHSPIVVQEVLSKYVTVLRKIDGHATAINLNNESFGTSIDNLTSEVFGLAADMPSYVTLLSELAKNKVDLNEVENQIGKKLSVEARSFYLSMLES
jgi:ABC-type cobalamin/Fe3+-siderophores transport system ATPase subunit